MLIDCCVEGQGFGCHRGFHAPHDGIKLSGEDEPDAETLSWQTDGSLEPLAPLVVSNGVDVLNPGALSRVQGESAVLVLKDQPDLFECVAVVLHLPPHGLVLAPRLKI